MFSTLIIECRIAKLSSNCTALNYATKCNVVSDGPVRRQFCWCGWAMHRTSIAMDRSLRYLLDIDITSVGDQLPDLSAAEAEASPSKCRPGSLSDVTPSDMSQIDSSVVVAKTGHTYFSPEDGFAVSPQRQSNHDSGTNHLHVSDTLSHDLLVSAPKSDDKNDDCIFRPETIADDRDQNLRFLSLKESSSGTCCERATNIEVVEDSEVALKITGTRSTNTDIKNRVEVDQDESNGLRITGPPSFGDQGFHREVHSQTRTVAQTGAESNSGACRAVPFLSDVEQDAAKRIHEPLALQRFCPPLISSCISPRYKMVDEVIPETKQESLSVSSEPSCPFHRGHNKVERATAAVLPNAHGSVRRQSQEASQSATVRDTLTALVEMRKGAVESSDFRQEYVDEFGTDLGLLTSNLSQRKRSEVGTSRGMSHDVPITDFELSNGGLDNATKTSPIVRTLDRSFIDIGNKTALGHISQLYLTPITKTTRGLHESRADDDAPLSRWRRKRRKTGTNVGQSSRGDDNGKAEQVKLQRALRNRESARRSRIKSKLQFQNMERRYAELSEENIGLVTLVESLLPQSMKLRPSQGGEILDSAMRPS